VPKVEEKFGVLKVERLKGEMVGSLIRLKLSILNITQGTLGTLGTFLIIKRYRRIIYIYISPKELYFFCFVLFLLNLDSIKILFKLYSGNFKRQTFRL
jgi:hypothetical protein